MSQFARSFLLSVLCAAPLVAQAPDDGLMMQKKTLSLGVSYARESWDEYWEGSLKRSNENIGSVTTQTGALVGHFGFSDRVSLATEIPYVWTRSTQGTLRGFSGVQDVTVALKYRAFSTAFTERGTLSTVIVGAASIPGSHYSPDLQPLSIGLGSRRASGRVIAHYEDRSDWFLEGSAAHTWRNNVNLDRQAYYTNGQLYLTNEVAMPDVFDWKVSTGFRKKRVFIPLSISQQRTLGGGDIRRQDMPFMSNRMNFTKIAAMMMYGLTVPTDLAVQF